MVTVLIVRDIDSHINRQFNSAQKKKNAFYASGDLPTSPANRGRSATVSGKASAGVYCQTGNEKRTTFRKSNASADVFMRGFMQDFRLFYEQQFRFRPLP